MKALQRWEQMWVWGRMKSGLFGDVSVDRVRGDQDGDVPDDEDAAWPLSHGFGGDGVAILCECFGLFGADESRDPRVFVRVTESPRQLTAEALCRRCPSEQVVSARESFLYRLFFLTRFLVVPAKDTMISQSADSTNTMH